MRIATIPTILAAAALSLQAETVTSTGRLDLSGTWFLREQGNTVQFSLPMHVLVCILSALFAAGLMLDPYFFLFFFLL